MNRKTAVLSFALLLPAFSLRGQSAIPETPLSALPYSPSLDLSSMDRSADPCMNFYRYACGLWMQKNPIPADQARWDVYAKLANENQRFLWGLLEEAAKPAANRGAVETQIGDFFYACMDEAAVERAGAAPLKPELDQIATLKSIRDLPAFLAQLQLAVAANQIAFGFSSNQDYADSTRVIAFASAGGLGLPDRDYYVKTDAKSQETRQRYLEHVHDMLELLGEPSPLANTHAQIVMDIETALANASLTRVDRRDPHK